MLSSEFFLQTSLLSAMLGASIGFSIQEGFTHPTAFVIIAIIALILHLVNFYHAKVGRLYDRSEQLAANARPYTHVSIILSNILLFATFCVMALKIATVAAICLGEVTIRVIDIVTVAAQLRVGDRSPGRAAIDPNYARQLRYWQLMNAVTLVIFASIFIAAQFISRGVSYPLAVTALAVLVAVDLGIEYGVFAKNYFQGLDDWDRLAERWDQLQGEFGDGYRERVINPFLEAWVPQRAGLPEGAVIIDVGCGNGCASRVIGRQGYHSVAFDRAERLVEIGMLYPSTTIRYLVADVDEPSSMSLVEDAIGTKSGRRAAMALFTLQDCTELAPAFELLAAILRDGEYLLVIFETEEGFQTTGVHTTTARTWKYSATGKRRQIVSWLPVTEPNPTSVCARIRDDPDLLISTITNFRTVDDYRAVAEPDGFVLTESGMLRSAAVPRTIGELRYDQAPKFAFAEFVRAPLVPVPRESGDDMTVGAESQ
ncbi:MAG TPA: hypothetical protein VMA95_05765 [Streptosporangiaceae bacterium]|nr:hypothetical protein [Streptosporangiaceae bacterium]